MYYIASPYTNPDPMVMEIRYEDVKRFCAQAARLGHIVYSPIMHWHPAAVNYDLPKDHVFWGRMDRAFINICDTLVVLQLPGWTHSKGVLEEVEYARSIGKPVVFVKTAAELV